MWKEAQNLGASTFDFHRRDLWDAIEAAATVKAAFNTKLIEAIAWDRHWDR